jgi:uncharacterized protein (TIGR00106 family)
MAIAEVKVVPVGTGEPGVSKYVAEAVSILKSSGVQFELTPMGTIIEGEIDELLGLARQMHEAPFAAGAQRVLTTISIDDRRDRVASGKEKVASVHAKLQVSDRKV